MRVFQVGTEAFAELGTLPDALPVVLPSASPTGFVWASFARNEFEACLPQLHAALQRWGCGTLIDLHVQDLVSEQLPSHFESTSSYDLMVFRRLAAANHADTADAADQMDTSPVGFAIFDTVLITVHPGECGVRDFFAERLLQFAQSREQRGSARLPASPTELMLRMANHMADGYLDLRRVLARQFTALHKQLLDPRSNFADWSRVMSAREALARVEETCEDQRSAMQEWIDALSEWPDASDAPARRERELLRVRGRDVLEHTERVLAHVRRLDSATDAAVQMHFSTLSQRTNRIMQTLTVLTAIFLPLNLITGIFGMNFDALPLIHRQTGFWIAVGLMLALGLGLALYFWRKRYLSAQK